MSRESGQALVEWAVSAFALLLFAFGLLAVGHVVGEYSAVRSAASQAAFAAARAPSGAAAERAGRRAALEALAASDVREAQVSLDTRGFQRGGTLTTTVSGCVSLVDFPIVSRSLGSCVRLHWTAQALIEPYRSRTP